MKRIDLLFMYLKWFDSARVKLLLSSHIEKRKWPLFSERDDAEEEMCNRRIEVTLRGG